MGRSFLCSAASCSCPVSGGSRQPLDRQVRYYSERAQVASRDFGTSVGGAKMRVGLPEEKRPQKAGGATPPRRWRLGSCDGHWPLEQMSVVLPTVSAVARPGSLGGDALCRFLRSLADRIPGSLLHHWHPPDSNWGAVQLFHSSQ